MTRNAAIAAQAPIAQPVGRPSCIETVLERIVSAAPTNRRHAMIAIVIA
jgi:hypothetical protein